MSTGIRAISRLKNHVMRSVRRQALLAWDKRFRQTILSRATTLELDPARPVIVLAPHQDDETLGCGGTIASLTRAGGSVTVIFATDGSGSHRDEQVPPSELAALREQEARDACEVLGVAPENCMFLRNPDGSLSDRLDALTDVIAQVVARNAATDVFVCSHYDAHPDHKALYQAARAASRVASFRLLQYPIWFWQYECWSNTTPRYPFDASQVKRAQSAVCQSNTILVSDVSEHLDRKRVALDCHRTQMGTLPGHTDWARLDQAFLRPLFDGKEIFLVPKEQDD